MKHPSQLNTVLIADDDLDDCVLVKEAFGECGQDFNLTFVHDGIQLLQYLRHQGAYADSDATQRPDIILLDLNMPLKDGHEALAEVKADPYLRSIPVVVLTISSREEDVLRTYELGGSGFIIKPTSLYDMVEVVKVLNEYWFEVVELSGIEHVNKIKGKNFIQ